MLRTFSAHRWSSRIYICRLTHLCRFFLNRISASPVTAMRHANHILRVEQRDYFIPVVGIFNVVLVRLSRPFKHFLLYLVKQLLDIIRDLI